MNDVKKIAFIPARSGSKGLPDKNIRRIGCETLIEIAVRNAFASNVFDYVLFTSDSRDYLDIIQTSFSSEEGLLLHERKSGHGDGDEVDAMIIEVLEEVFENEELNVVLLYPTSPGRSSDSILQASNQFDEFNGSRPLISVTRFTDYVWTNHPYVYPLNYNPRDRQSRQKHKDIYYKENKSIYIFSSSLLKESGTRIYDTPILFEMPDHESIDIDSINDLLYYQLVHEKKG